MVFPLYLSRFVCSIIHLTNYVSVSILGDTDIDVYLVDK